MYIYVVLESYPLYCESYYFHDYTIYPLLD